MSSLVSSLTASDDLLHLPEAQVASGQIGAANVTTLVKRGTGAPFGDRDPSGIPDLPLMEDMEPLKPLDGRDGNFCLDGHLNPILWVLGPAKSGTSSMTLDLVNAGIVNNYAPQKESHFFDDMIYNPGGGLAGLTELDIKAMTAQHRGFLTDGPICPSEPRVMGDFTPDNFRNYFLPPVLQRLYGPRFSQLKFVIVVRKPIDRLISAYYFRASENGMKMNWAQLTVEVTNTLRLARLPLRTRNPSISIDQRILQSMYGRMMRSWLDDWKVPAKQFYVVPMHTYFEGPSIEYEGKMYTSKQRVFIDLSRWLEVDLVTNASPNAVHINGVNHPKTKRSFPALIRTDLNRFLKKDVKSFVSRIAAATSEGLVLGLYDGDKGNEAQIHQYFKAGWQ